jgi:hypothetical protein
LRRSRLGASASERVIYPLPDDMRRITRCTLLFSSIQSLDVRAAKESARHGEHPSYFQRAADALVGGNE